MRIMFDECITQGVATFVCDFLRLYDPPIEGVFLVDYLRGQGQRDVVWAKQLQAEGGWRVITADRGKRHKNQQKRLADGPDLHRILPECGITAVFLSSSLHSYKMAQKAQAIIAAWPDIHRFFQSSKPGDRRQLTAQGLKAW